ncbi:MAG: HEAT repeat domain-containing protein, partial [Balneolaceae bacterium]
EWLPDYNEDGSHDWRDLTVEKDEVYLLEDLTGNSLANRSQLFYRGFNDEVTDIAGTVLNHNDELFVGASPKLWRLKDTNDDGVADHTEVVTEGYGVHITFSGHGMSGLVKGPDGRIYWGIGDFGLNTIDDEDNRLEYPHTGSIIRMEPDGSGVEVFATGLRNTHEFVFDKYGNLISVDNDGDYPGEHERLVYLIDGSDTGWRINWQFGKYSDPKNNDYNVWMNENYYQPRFDNQAAHLLPPISAYHNGPAGMVYNPGTALGDQWKDHFFVAGFVGNRARSGIDAFTLEPNGASFNLASDKEVIRGILATGLDVGPDGSLYIADWIEGWAPNKEGWIWKMDDPAEAGSASRRQTRNLLENSFAGESGEDLLAWLGHSDMRVRMKAQFELVSRQDDEWLLSALKDGNNQLQRIHGIWGLGQLGRQQSERVSPLTDLLMDEDPEIRAQAARTLGDAGYEPAGESLIPLLADENERVRFFAAEALGRLEYEPAFTPIVEMLQKNNDEDVYLRQAGAIALSRIGNSDRQISALADHPSRAVRIAAVVALKRLTDPGITRFLEDEDEYIVTNAARAINDDDFIEEAVPDLARLLDQTQFINEPLLRRAINANLYHGQAEDARRIARFTERDDVPLQVREEAVMALSVWPDPSLLDRVTGRYRGPVANEPEHARQAFEPVALHLFQDDHPEIRRAAVEAVRRLEIRIAESQLVNLLDSDPASSVRIAALKALIELEYEDLERIFSIALNDGEISVRQTALGMIPDLDLSSADIANLVHPVLETGSVAEQQTVLQTLGRLHHPDANEILEDYLDRMIDGQVSPEIELDIMEAAEQADSEPLNRRLDQYRN